MRRHLILTACGLVLSQLLFGCTVSVQSPTGTSTGTSNIAVQQQGEPIVRVRYDEGIEHFYYPPECAYSMPYGEFKIIAARGVELEVEYIRIRIGTMLKPKLKVGALYDLRLKFSDKTKNQLRVIRNEGAHRIRIEYDEFEVIREIE